MPQQLTNRLTRNWTVALSVATYLIVVVSTRGARYPFDDEGIVLYAILSNSFAELVNRCLHGFDFHPPLSYLLFFGAFQLGLRANALQWLSASFTAIALGLWCWMSIESIEDIRPALTIPTALLFGLTPLAIGQGDAIRWYPPFTLLIAVAYLIYWRSKGYWWLSAIPLGLAADCEFLALLPFATILIHRYALRKARPSVKDGLFFVIVGILALPGFFVAYSVDLFIHPFAVFATSQIRFNPKAGILTNLLGFFGGSRLGISLVWLVLLATISAGYLAVCAWRQRRETLQLETLSQLVAITTFLTLPMCLPGFGKPRSLLFLAPMVSAMIAIGFSKAVDACPTVATGACAGVLAVSLALIANLQMSRVPFKRNLVVPYEELIDFVTSNARGNTVVFTSDLVAGISLRGISGICVAQFEVGQESWSSDCQTSTHWDRVIVVKGSPLEETDPIWKRRVNPTLDQRERIAESHFGFDHDTILKNRLTRSSLSQWILSVAMYR